MLLSASHFSSVDPYDFPDNMNMIAVVMKDGQRLTDAEVAAFIGGECRGAIRTNEDSEYYFLTVMGSSNEDRNSKVEIRVFADGEEYVVESDKTFVSDAIYGTLDEPYVLDLNATGIRRIDVVDDSNDTEWYTLEGFKIGRKPTKSGIYIHRGQKVTIRAKSYGTK